MTNLVIDIGNTRTKVALFEKDEIIVRFQTDTLSKNDIYSLTEDYPFIECAIVSTVRNDAKELLEFLKNIIAFVVELDHKTVLPIVNKYETPETLGKDRLAAAIGANKTFPNHNILIIDAGTAITYDFVNENNEYTGGFITPGLNMRYKALHHFTEKLPLLQPSKPFDFIGNNTSNSITGGIQYGIEGEIQRMIAYFSPIKGELKIILTGGDIKYFEKLLKNHKFVAREITLLGLNTILDFNYIR